MSRCFIYFQLQAEVAKEEWRSLQKGLGIEQRRVGTTPESEFRFHLSLWEEVGQDHSAAQRAESHDRMRG